MTVAIGKKTKIVSAAAVAEELGVAGSTVRQYVREGRIPIARKTPGGHARFDLDEVREALASETTEDGAPVNRPLARRQFRPLAEQEGEVRVNLSEQPFVIAEDWQLAFGVAAASITTGDDDDVDPVVGVRGSGRFAVERELVHA